MKISLRSEKTIKEINRELATEFPFLKLCFFRHPHHTGQGSPIEDAVPGCTQLIDIIGVLREVTFEIKSSQKVREVEQMFQDYLGLPVQVFRKQHGVWLETITTDSLTMKEQNEMGKESSNLVEEVAGERYIDWE